MNKKIILGAVVVVAIIAAVIVFATHKPSRLGAVGTTSSTNFNGVIGALGSKIGTNCGDSNSFQYCTGVVTQGGSLSTTTSVSLTLQPSDLGYGTILMTPIVGSITVTLPATTTAGMSSFLPNTGDTTQIIIVNSTTTAAQNLTIAGNTGMKLSNASTSATIIGGGNQGVATLEFVRKSNTDINVIFSPSI